MGSGIERHTGDLMHVAFIVSKCINHWIVGSRSHTRVENVIRRNTLYAPRIGAMSVDFGLCRQNGASKKNQCKRYLDYADEIHFTSTVERPTTLRPLPCRKRPASAPACVGICNSNICSAPTL